MKIAILTMFNGLSSTYSLVNVVAEHLRMLLDHNIEVKMLVSQDCPDSDRIGIFADERIEWVKICNRFQGRIIDWKDYSHPEMEIHPTFFMEAHVIAADLEKNLQDVSVCIMEVLLK